MSQPKVLTPLPFELVYDDGEPLETVWHSIELPFLRHLLLQAMEEHDRTDFYVGINMFVYYSVEQAREVAEEEQGIRLRRAYRGPDVFWVGGVAPNWDREIWIAWEEDGRLPDVIFEMLAPTTALKDRTEKKDLYARVFGTAEYFMYEPATRKLEGLRLADHVYHTIQPDENERFWSKELGASVGLWYGAVEGKKDHWVRLFRPDGSLIPTKAEAARQQTEEARQQADEARQRTQTAARQRAEMEHQQADAERHRADAAEAENARLRALLEERARG